MVPHYDDDIAMLPTSCSFCSHDVTTRYDDAFVKVGRRFSSSFLSFVHADVSCDVNINVLSFMSLTLAVLTTLSVSLHVFRTVSSR